VISSDRQNVKEPVLSIYIYIYIHIYIYIYIYIYYKELLKPLPWQIRRTKSVPFASICLSQGCYWGSILYSYLYDTPEDMQPLPKM
jgi:hypothetical protein